MFSFLLSLLLRFCEWLGLRPSDGTDELPRPENGSGRPAP
jgi:hypothetical protein